MHTPLRPSVVSHSEGILFSAARALAFFQIFGRFLGPDKCRGVGVVMIDGVSNRPLKLVHTPETSVANSRLSHVTKPPLNHVQP